MSSLLQRNDDGTLPCYAWPGGYDIRYMCADGESVCARCANEWQRDEWQGQEPIAQYIHWEGADEHCARCNEPMPSEYGEPEEEE
jgi:hypothetical protein